MSEQEIKEDLARSLTREGYEVYVDHSRDPSLKKFKGTKKGGSQRKPDIIVFFEMGGAIDQKFHIESPIGIEVKPADSYNQISKVVQQMESYKNCPVYLCDGREVVLKTLVLATQGSLSGGYVYAGSDSFPRTKSDDSKYAIEWSLVRQLFSLRDGSGKNLSFGILKRGAEGRHLMKFPNFALIFEGGGRLCLLKMLDLDGDKVRLVNDV